jgi:hypothetical protein
MNDDPALDLEIRILRSDRRNGSCPVDIRGPHDSRAEGRFRSPFTEAQTQDAIVALDLGRFDSAPAREFGESLFRALIRDDVKTVYDANGGNADQTGLRLIVDDPKVARIPWELMADPVAGTPFAIRHRLVRGFSTTTGARPVGVQPPLRVLLAESSPTGVQRLESQLEVRDIREALEPLTANGRIAVDVLSNVSEESLLNALREGANRAVPPKPVHVFHWIGHGGIDPATGNAALLFEDEAGRRDTVEGARLATILSGFDIRLVFLNACYSAAPTAAAAGTASSFEVTAGLAEALLDSGIPGVIGMQATVRDDRARRFARDFYESLADGVTIDAAILDARRLVREGADGSAADIGIPVCYLRAGSTRLLEVPHQGSLRGLPYRVSSLGRGAKALIGIAATTVLATSLLIFVGFPRSRAIESPSAIPSLGVSDAKAIGGGPSPSSSPSSSPSPSSGAVALSDPMVVITSAMLSSEAGQISYEIDGTAVGVADPPWKLLIIAWPKLADAAPPPDGWWVSKEVVPGPDGRWSALLLADVLPRNAKGVRFEPVLVKSLQPVPTTTPPTPLPTLLPGQSPTPPAMDTTAGVEEDLAAAGPDADVVDRTFGAFDVEIP